MASSLLLPAAPDAFALFPSAVGDERSSLNHGPSRGTIRPVNACPGFICVVVDDMPRSLTFYEHRLALVEAYGEIHVELELPGGLQIYWDPPKRGELHALDYRPAPHGRASGTWVPGRPARDVDALFTKLSSLVTRLMGFVGCAVGVRYAHGLRPQGRQPHRDL